jgi:multidrug efflux pump subunit AcrA (membrane-fusion protein)
MGSLHPQRTDLVTQLVKRENLQITITERGTLESADNREVVARVRSGSKGSTVATTIKWVIDDGTRVNQGQLLVDLDDSGFQEQLKNEQITLDQARALYMQAEEAYKIVKSQNESDIEAARINTILANLDVEKYRGEYQQSVNDIDGRKKIAESDLEMWRERAAWSKRMMKMKYISRSQAEADVSRLESAEISLKKLSMEARVLDLTKNRTQTDLEHKYTEAIVALERTKYQARAKEVQANVDLQTKQSIYHKELTRYNEIEDEIRKCTILAPQDGLVVYYMSDQNRFGSGSQQGIIAQGEPVREGQKLMRIPDLKHMLVNTRINEAMISKVRGDMVERTGFSTCVEAALALNANPLANLMASCTFSEIKAEFGDKHRQEEQRILSDGQYAEVRVDAYPDQVLHGHVKQLALVASQQDWMSSDVKVYQSMISIDEPFEGLKPGMSAEVTIFTDSDAYEVLTVPVQAVLPAAMDSEGKPRVFVKTSSGETLEREVEIGLSNEKVVEIKAGLEEGEEVVLNPRALLSDKEKAKLPSANDKTGPSNSEPNKGRNGHNPPDKSGQASAIKPAGEAKLNKNTHSVTKP